MVSGDISYSPLLTAAVEMVRKYGVSEASEHVERIHRRSMSAEEGFEFLPPAKTLSEVVCEAMGVIGGGCGYEEGLRIVGTLPECPDKHYLAAIVELRHLDGHTLQGKARHELERALELDPGNPTYLRLAKMVEAEYSVLDARIKKDRDSQSRKVTRLSKHVGLG